MKLLSLVALFLAAGLVSLSGVFGSGATQAAMTTVEVTMTGAEENPPVTNQPTIRGFTRLIFDDVTKELTWAITMSGISPDEVTAAHIHRGARGVNGPVIYPFSLVGFTTAGGKITLTDADVADLRAGNLYVNAHTKTNPGGVVRAQIIMPAAAAPAPAPAAPSTVTPPRTGDGGLADQGAWWPLAALALVLGLGSAVVVVTRRA